MHYRYASAASYCFAGCARDTGKHFRAGRALCLLRFCRHGSGDDCCAILEAKHQSNRVGGTAGAIMAQRVEMTKMPELVAFMHSMIGLAAVFIAVAVVAEPWALLQEVQQGQPIPTGNRLEVALGAAIGAITFSGSVIAFGKLSGKYKFRLFQGAPVVFAGQHKLNLVLGLATVGLGQFRTAAYPAAVAWL
mgnify:CR=1 FL=1